MVREHLIRLDINYQQKSALSELACYTFKTRMSPKQMQKILF